MQKTYQYSKFGRKVAHGSDFGCVGSPVGRGRCDGVQGSSINPVLPGKHDTFSATDVPILLDCSVVFFYSGLFVCFS